MLLSHLGAEVVVFCKVHDEQEEFSARKKKNKNWFIYYRGFFSFLS